MIYEYKCLTCSKVFEKEVNLKELQLLKELGQKTTPNCKYCKSSNTKKIISVSNTIFKGEGFTKSSQEV